MKIAYIKIHLLIKDLNNIYNNNKEGQIKHQNLNKKCFSRFRRLKKICPKNNKKIMLQRIREKFRHKIKIRICNSNFKEVLIISNMRFWCHKIPILNLILTKLMMLLKKQTMHWQYIRKKLMKFRIILKKDRKNIKNIQNLGHKKKINKMKKRLKIKYKNKHKQQ